jgi:hypothetical protein
MPDLIPRDTMYIPQGATFEKSWPLIDRDTGLTADATGWQFRCEVRQAIGGALITRFHSTQPWDGTLTVDDAGNLTARLESTFTAALDVLKNGFFDVEGIDPSGDPWRLVQGRAHVTPEVTTDV